MPDSAQKTGRDKRGRFLPGNRYRWEKGVCPNPKGRPTTAHLLGLLHELLFYTRVGEDLERLLDETVRVRVDGKLTTMTRGKRLGRALLDVCCDEENHSTVWIAAMRLVLERTMPVPTGYARHRTRWIRPPVCVADYRGVGG